MYKRPVSRMYQIRVDYGHKLVNRFWAWAVKKVAEAAVVVVVLRRMRRSLCINMFLPCNNKSSSRR